MGLYSFIIYSESGFSFNKYFINTLIDAESLVDAVQKYILGDSFRDMRVAKLIDFSVYYNGGIGTTNMNVSRELSKRASQKTKDDFSNCSSIELWPNEDVYRDFIHENIKDITKMIMNANFLMRYCFEIKEEVEVEGCCMVKAARTGEPCTSANSSANSSASATND